MKVLLVHILASNTWALSMNGGKKGSSTAQNEHDLSDYKNQQAVSLVTDTSEGAKTKQELEGGAYMAGTIPMDQKGMVFACKYLDMFWFQNYFDRHGVDHVGEIDVTI